MGCFSTCFGNSKRSPTCRQRRRQRQRQRIANTNPSLLEHLQKYNSVDGFQVPGQLIEEQQEDIEKGEIQIELIPDSNDEKSEKSNSSERKKVTFDMNVRVYEDLGAEEEELSDNLKGNSEEETEETAEIKGRKSVKAVNFGSECNSDSSSSSLFSFPLNHRYQNCMESDDDFDGILSSDESEIDDFSDDDGGGGGGKEEVESEVKNDKEGKTYQEQSSESLFSLSLDSRKHGFGTETGEREVNSPIPIKISPPDDSNSEEIDRNSGKYVDSVLNPVENLSQWKSIKARSKLASKDHQAKENKISGEEFSFSVKKESISEKKIGIDTSLSSWLVGSEGTTKNHSRSSSVSVGNSPSDRKSISPNKFEDRPILGALTIEELRQISANSSPRKSPSKSPEDVPIIGSVGSYWSHSALTADSATSTRSTKSRYRESAEVIWDSTPFETRLEKALEKEGSAEQILAASMN